MIKKSIEKFNIPQDIVTYKADKLERILSDGQTIESLIGKEYIHKGFMSTTPLEHVTRENAESWSSDVIIKIKLNKGTGKGAYIKNYSIYKNENELLLKPNMRFKIIKYIPKYNQKLPTLLMEEII
ncbi:MAG: hypothetical protein GX362_05315 [Methanosarcinaceae archaeon]|nr:hypothetical protein [Methanosarcinaceae archaeon]